MKCKKCGKVLEEEQDFCNECNSSLTEEQKKELLEKEKKAERTSSIAVIIMYVSIIIFFLLTQGSFAGIHLPDEMAILYLVPIIAPTISITIASAQKYKYPDNGVINLNLILTAIGFLLLTILIIEILVHCYNDFIESASHCG